MQKLASGKGIGIAHPGLDARDRELARSGGSRRAGQRRPDRHDLSRGIESCRPGLQFRLLVAQTVGEPQALAEGVDAPEPARRHGRSAVDPLGSGQVDAWRSEEYTSELQSLMRTSDAVYCLKKKHKKNRKDTDN